MGEATTWAKAQECWRPRDPAKPDAPLRADPRAKAVLVAASCYANVLGEFWVGVTILAVETSLGNERAVQRGLADLKAAGLIEETGRFETYKGKRFPIYRLPLERGPANTRERMIIERERAEELGVSPVSPQAGDWGDTHDTPRGDTDGELGVTLVTPKEIQLNIQSNSEGAREPIFDLMTRLRAAYPRRALGWSDPDAALAELGKLIAEGIDVEQLPGCAERMGQDPAIKRRDFGPPKLEAWLAKRQFEGWWPEPEREAAPADQAGKAPDPVEALPSDVVAAFGSDFVRAWLGGARWRDEDHTLITARIAARDKIIRDRHGVLREHGWRVIAQADLPSEQPSQGA